jgi:hypothetical protein
MDYGTTHHPDLKLLLCHRFARKHGRAYDGKQKNYGRHQPAGNGPVAVSPFPKQLEWITGTARRVCPARNAVFQETLLVAMAYLHHHH